MKEEIQSRRYEPPNVEVLQVDVEHGFAGSEAGATTPGWRVVSETQNDDFLFDF